MDLNFRFDDDIRIYIDKCTNSPSCHKEDVIDKFF